MMKHAVQPDSMILKKPVLYTGAALTLVLIILVAISFGKAVMEPPISDKAKRPDNMLFGLACYWEDEMIGLEQIGRRYYAENLDGERGVCLGESFGVQIDDYTYDLDGDGIEELICNCVFGGDGAFRVMIYRLRDGIIEVGRIPENDLELPGFQNWGANAIKEYFDVNVGCVVLEYSSENGTRSVTCNYSDFEFIPFETPSME